VSGVQTERDGPSIRRAYAALGAEDEELRPAQLLGVPAHAGVLGEAENVAAGRLAQQLLGQRQTAGRPGGAGLDVEQGGVGIDEGREGERGRGHGLFHESSGLGMRISNSALRPQGRRGVSIIPRFGQFGGKESCVPVDVASCILPAAPVMCSAEPGLKRMSRPAVPLATRSFRRFSPGLRTSGAAS
jgi:hypothetical protein